MPKLTITLPFVVASLLVMSGCDQRKGAEAQFIGTWQSTSCVDCTNDYTFYPDHTFIMSGESLGRYWLNDTGKWFLDYKRILLRRNNRKEPALVILNIHDVTPDEVKISHADRIGTLKRIKTLTREEIQRMVDGATRVSITQ